MAGRDDVTYVIGADDRTKRPISSATRNVEDFTNKAQLAAAALVVAGVAVTAAAVGIATGFETGMREVNTLLSLPEAGFEALRADTKALSRELGVVTTEVVPALYQAISAGIPQDNVFDFLRIAGQAAIGGVTTTEVAVDALSTAVNAFASQGLEAADAADILFTGVKGGKTNFEQLAQAIGKVAPLANSLGVEFSEMVGALAALTTQGFSTREATTALRGALQGIIRPTADLTALWQDAGFESAQAAIEAEGLAGALGIVQDAAEGDQGALLTMVGSIEGVNAILGLTGQNAEQFSKQLALQAERAGSSAAAFEEMEKSAGALFRRFKADLNLVMIEFGERVLPSVLKVTQSLIGIMPTLADGFATVADVVVVVLDALTLFTDLLGVLPAGIGGLIVGIGGLGLAASVAAPLIATMAASVWSFNAALLANPVGLAVVGAALAVVAIRMTATAAATSTSTDDMIAQIRTLGDHRRALLADKDMLTGTVAGATAYGEELRSLDDEIARVTSALNTQLTAVSANTAGFDALQDEMAAARGTASSFAAVQDEVADAMARATASTIDQARALQSINIRALAASLAMDLFAESTEEAAGRGATSFDAIIDHLQPIFDAQASLAGVVEAIFKRLDPQTELPEKLGGAVRDAVGRGIDDAIGEASRSGLGGLLGVLIARDIQGGRPASEVLDFSAVDPAGLPGAGGGGGGGGTTVIIEGDVVIGGDQPMTAADVGEAIAQQVQRQSFTTQTRRGD